MEIISDFFIKGIFFFEKKIWGPFINFFRIICLRCKGAKIGKNVYIGHCWFTWSHKVAIDKDSIIENNVYFKYDGPYSRNSAIIIGKKTFIGTSCEFNIAQKITIGDKCLIASGCRFIDHDHGVAKDRTINIQNPVIAPIVIEDDVWLGVNVVVLKGVRIGKGAVVGAGSVVTRNVGEYEIVGGVPARLLKKRI